MLYYVILYDIILYYTILYYIILYYIILYHIILYYIYIYHYIYISLHIIIFIIIYIYCIYYIYQYRRSHHRSKIRSTWFAMWRSYLQKDGQKDRQVCWLRTFPPPFWIEAPKNHSILAWKTLSALWKCIWRNQATCHWREWRVWELYVGSWLSRWHKNQKAATSWSYRDEGCARERIGMPTSCWGTCT
jgi:hypothetical protein